MSIIRLSLLEDGLYAPDEHGVITYDGPFSARRGPDNRGLGNMGVLDRGTLPDARHPLTRHLDRALKTEAASLPEDAASGPVAILIHGFQFDPATSRFCPPHHPKATNPHCRLYHFDEHDEAVEMRHHSTGWPRGLGFERDDAGRAGLAIGFGWDSNPSLFHSLFEHGLNHYAVAYNRAEVAAWHLVAVIETLTRLAPGRRIDLFCHSLGSRVVLRALAQAADPKVPDAMIARLGRVIEALDRIILLAGAEKVLEAQLMMTRLNRRTPRGPRFARVPDFYNIVSRENDVLDKLGENFGPAAPGSKQVIGHNGLEARDPSWVDIQLDDAAVAAWFRGRGYTVSGDNESSLFAVLDHWIHYTWRDNMRVYRDILRSRPNWTIASLKTEPALFDRVRLNRGPGAVGFG